MSNLLPEIFPTATPPGSDVTASASAAEKSATLMKPRSCVMCRSRKVRCDRESPCSNCRKGNIPCVSPSDRPPRWARRLASKAQASQEPKHPAAAQVMERVRNLESLVSELRGQLELANTTVNSSLAGGPSGILSPGSSTHHRGTDQESDIQKQFGRLAFQSANESHYVNSGFWSRINDELDGLKMDSGLMPNDSDTSDDEGLPNKSPSTQEFGRTPLDRHAFLFRHNLSLSTPDLREFQPLPSQIPFLLDVFSENVNSIIGIVHIPSLRTDLRSSGSGMVNLTPSNEALMFSIYYAAITSMEEDDVMTNFGFTKSDLNLKYRLGLEKALAKADFLSVPDLVLVQALAIFLLLVRRHDSPSFVWMMTGLVIRMGQSIGLHRDGANFEHLTPYESEMRRRVWWALCLVDGRAAEDQGTENMIAHDSFDTKVPLNINDADIGPEISQMPTEREGITDMTIPLIWIEIGKITQQMMTQSAKKDAPSIEEQSRLLDEIYHTLDRRYLQFSAESNIAYWVAVTVTRIVMAKMTLLIYLPVLFSSPSEHFSDSIKTKLLIAAIELSEHNHALNSEQTCRHWHWACQTYTHWHAIIFLLIEIPRRPWSCIVERAWVALHSQWLIPSQTPMKKTLWFPLRKLMGRARKHRDAELERLRSDPMAAERLDMEDQMIPAPESPGPFPIGSNAMKLFRQHWHQLLALPAGPGHETRTSGHFGLEVTDPPAHSTYAAQLGESSKSTSNAANLVPNTTFESAYHEASGLLKNQNLPSNTSSDFQLDTMRNAFGDFPIEEIALPLYNAAPANDADSTVPINWSVGAGPVPWLWADMDSSVDVFANMDEINMDLNGNVDWYNWIESAKGMEMAG